MLARQNGKDIKYENKKQNSYNFLGDYLDILAVSCDSFDEETNQLIGRQQGGKSHVDALMKVRRWCHDYKVSDVYWSVPDSLIHSLNHSFTHLLTHSLTHSFTHLLTHSLTHSLIPQPSVPMLLHFGRLGMLRF